jgi:hypothetical protein
MGSQKSSGSRPELFACAGAFMQREYREGDWVRHHSSPEPLRVVGIGSTIAVRFPKGEMRAFEPCELENVDLATLPACKLWAHRYINGQCRGFVEQYVLVTSVTLLYLTMLVWWLMAGRGR